jgi:hypothetical protein
MVPDKRGRNPVVRVMRPSAPPASGYEKRASRILTRGLIGRHSHLGSTRLIR